MKSFDLIKYEAKEYMRRDWLTMAAVGALGALLAGKLSQTSHYAGENTLSIHIGPFHYAYNMSGLGVLGSMMVAVIALCAVAAAVVFAIYVKNPLEYSIKSWFRHQTDGSSEGRIFSVFRSPDYHRIVGTMLRRDLTIFVYSLLLVIPGIMKAYEYYFVPQLLEEHPELSPQEILDLCSDMTYGRRMELFSFDLSFIGWFLLEAITGGISGIFWSYGYRTMSRQLLFLDYIESGIDPLNWE